MKELLTELDESLNNLKLVPPLSNIKLCRSYSHEVNQHLQISSPNPFVDFGTQIIQNKRTKQFLPKTTHNKDKHSKFYQKLSSQNSLHTQLNESSSNLLSKSQYSDKKDHKHSPLNNITIYNLEVFNVSSNDIFNQNFNKKNDRSKLLANKTNIYNSFYLSPRIESNSNLGNLLEPNYVHRVKKHKSTHQPKSNTKLYTFNNKTSGCEETTDSIKNTFINNNSIKQQSSSRNNNRNNATFEIIVSRKENSSNSVQSNNSSTSSKHGKNLTNIKKFKMFKKKSNKSKLTQNNLNVNNNFNESNLCDISKIHLSKTNKSSFRNVNQFNNGYSVSNNPNNISSSMLHTNPKYLITNDRNSVVDGYSDSEQDDNTSLNKRSMNRLRLTNIFNPYNMVNIAPSEFNAISHSSETEISNIFIQPTQSLLNKQTDSHRSSFIYKQPSLNNKSQYQHSKSNKNDRRNRKLGLTNTNNNVQTFFILKTFNL